MEDSVETQTLTATPTLALPQVGGRSEGRPTIPGYELLEKIGEGGMGEVYRATQVNLQRTVAVKIMRLGSLAGLAGSADFAARSVVAWSPDHATPAPGPMWHGWETVPQRRSCLAGSADFAAREALVTASLNHPNVVAIHDCGEAGGYFFLVMEFVAGSNLRKRMRPGEPWPVTKAAPVLDTVARALTYIHDQGILHLDLKPENVLCNHDGEIRVSDFGLALARVDARTRSELDVAQGTIDYSAPEQRHGLGVDARSDLFSLATLSYELLTGRLPGRVYVPATQRNARLPRRIDEVLRRALGRDKDERQPTIEAFREELAAALGVEKRRRRAALTTIMALVIGALAAMLLMKVWLGINGASGPSTTRTVSTGCWLLYDQPETTSWLEAGAVLEPPAGLVLERLQTTYQLPSRQIIPLPAWPEPRPALVIATPATTAFVHPFENAGLGQHILSNWSALQALPAPKTADNFVQAGGFETDAPAVGQWQRVNQVAWRRGDGITVAFPPERPKNSALLLTKKEVEVEYLLTSYQMLDRMPERGQTVVLRYRAWAEEGEGRLSVGPHHAVHIPFNDDSSAARRLRSLSRPNSTVKNKPKEEGLLYGVRDWVSPTTTPQTYCVVWEWPPYCTTGAVVITYAGLGKVWIDDVEMFVWEHPVVAGFMPAHSAAIKAAATGGE